MNKQLKRKLDKEKFFWTPDQVIILKAKSDKGQDIVQPTPKKLGPKTE